MDLKQLRYFLAVVEHGSFSRAANVLGIAQPAISRQVRQLEVQLKQNLLQRTGRGVICTSAGLLMTRHAEIILQSVTTAEQEMQQNLGVVSGDITIGIPTSLSKLIAPSLISYLKTALPEVTVALSDGLSITTQELLEDKRLDVAIIYEPIPNKDIELIPVMEQQLFLVTSARTPHKSVKPITLAEVSELPLVIPRPPHGIRILIDSAMRQVSARPKVLIEADSIHMILDCISDPSSSGYAILPLHSIANYAPLSRFSYRLIEKPQMVSKLFVVLLSRHTLSSKQRLVSNTIKEFCRTKLIASIRTSLETSSRDLNKSDYSRLAPMATVRLV